MGTPLRRREVVRDVEVWVRDPVGDRDEDDGARCPDDDHPPRERRPAPDQPGHHADRNGTGEPVGERQAEHPADRDLPCRHHPGPEQPPGPLQPHSTHGECDRQRDPAARDHLQMTVLFQPVGREGERRTRDRRSGRAEAELARQHICPEECERVGEDEEEVVADHGRVRAAADDSRGGIADQRVAEGKRVLERPEPVGVEEMQGLVEQRVPAPGRLPGLRQRVADVARHHTAEVDQQRPRHHDGEHRCADRGGDYLPAGQASGYLSGRSG